MTDTDVDPLDDGIRAAVRSVVMTSPEPPPLPDVAPTVVLRTAAVQARGSRSTSALTAAALVVALVATLGIVIVSRSGHPTAIARRAWTAIPEPRAVASTRLSTPQFLAIGARALLLTVDTTPDRGYVLRGSVYSPDTNRWTAATASPRVTRIPGVAVWTGRVVVVLTGVDASGASDRPLLYDPARSRWSSGSAAPTLASAARDGLYPAVWAGTELILPVQGLSYDPAQDHWRGFPPSPIGPFQYAVAGWSGHDVIVWGACDAGRPCTAADANGERPDAAAYNTDHGEWRILPRSPLVPRSGVRGVFVGGRLFLWGGYVAGADGYGATLDPATNQWTPVPDAPITRRARFGITVLGERVIVWGGHDATGTTGALRGDGASYDIRTGRWRMLPAGPLTPREYPSMTSVDATAIVWGGDQAEALTSGSVPLLHDGARYAP